MARARPRSWLATDLNPETLAVARAKPLPACVRFADRRCLHAGRASDDAALRRRLRRLLVEPRAAGAAAGWLELLHARLRPRRARGVPRQRASCQASSTPLSRRDADGNTYQQRTLDDGSVHEVLKNFPTRDEALAALGPRARDAAVDRATRTTGCSATMLVLMQTNLAPEFKGTRDGEAAEAILRKCVHCGFCTATCPTYQLLGDELDGPRGRIYLMKQVLEGAPVTRSTQLHLDRCLTCRNCETTCPSGVQYGHLVDIGRKIVEERVERPAGEKARALAAQGGPDLAAVRPGDEARPGCCARCCRPR